MKVSSSESWTISTSCGFPFDEEYDAEMHVVTDDGRQVYVQSFCDKNGILLAVSNKSLKDESWSDEEADEEFESTYDELGGNTSDSEISVICLNKASDSVFYELYKQLIKMLEEESKK